MAFRDLERMEVGDVGLEAKRLALLCGPLWKARKVVCVDLGACLSAAVMANGRRSMKAMVVGALMCLF